MDALGLKPPAAGCDVGADSEAEAPTVRPTLSQQISLLPQLNLSELRAEWRRLFRMQPPGLSRDLIVRGIAYRLQELAHGGLPKATVRKLARLGDELKTEGHISLDSGPQIKPGARLMREWHGRTYCKSRSNNPSLKRPIGSAAPESNCGS